MAATRRKLGDLLGATDRSAALSPEEIERVERGDPAAGTDLDPVERQTLVEDAALFDRLARDGRLGAAEQAAYDRADAGTRRRLGFNAALPVRRTRWLTAVGGLAAASLLMLALLLPGENERFVEVDWIPLMPPPTVRGESRATWVGLERDWAAADWPGAADRIEGALEASPEDSALLFYRALALYRAGRIRDARGAVERLVEQEGQSPSSLTLWLRAAIEQHQRDPRAACATLSEVQALGGPRADEAGALIADHCP